MSNPAAEGMVTVAASTFGVTVGATTKYVTAGNYYLSSAAPGGSVSLLAEVQARFIEAGADAGTTVTMSAGIVTLDFNHVLVAAFAWVGGLHTLLGFLNASDGGDETFVGAYQAKPLWLPSVAVSGWAGSLSSLGRVTTDRRSVKAADGTMFSRGGANVAHSNDIAFRCLAAARVWQGSETVVNQSWERFYADWICGAATGSGDGTVRWYTDSASATSYLVGSTPRDYMLDGNGQSDWTASRTDGRSDVLWDLSFNVCEANP